uniref:Uncharacterized protein n=1 Tax=Crocodylus porosus TaxID=8502 RepID=A0A7M4EW02_CROPO
SLGSLALRKKGFDQQVTPWFRFCLQAPGFLVSKPEGGEMQRGAEWLRFWTPGLETWVLISILSLTRWGALGKSLCLCFPLLCHLCLVCKGFGAGSVSHWVLNGDR